MARTTGPSNELSGWNSDSYGLNSDSSSDYGSYSWNRVWSNEDGWKSGSYDWNADSSNVNDLTADMGRRCRYQLVR